MITSENIDENAQTDLMAPNIKSALTKGHHYDWCLVLKVLYQLNR